MNQQRRSLLKYSADSAHAPCVGIWCRGRKIQDASSHIGASSRQLGIEGKLTIKWTDVDNCLRHKFQRLLG